MTEAQFHTLLKFLKVLGDESRLKIVIILAQGECSVEELAVLLKLKEPTISHHLGKLKELNLVVMRPEGNTHLYRLDSQALQRISKSFTAEKISSLLTHIDTQAWENKVLHTYLLGDFKNNNSIPPLKEIPPNRKKRLVILKWLVSHFEIGVNYPESTVNEILKRYHPDYTTLRRELISCKLMRRENEVYQRYTESGSSNSM